MKPAHKVLDKPLESNLDGTHLGASVAANPGPWEWCCSQACTSLFQTPCAMMLALCTKPAWSASTALCADPADPWPGEEAPEHADLPPSRSSGNDLGHLTSRHRDPNWTHSAAVDSVQHQDQPSSEHIGDRDRQMHSLRMQMMQQSFAQPRVYRALGRKQPIHRA